MRVVLDTNVFISGIHWTGACEKILRAWMDNKFELVCSLPIIEEFVRVLMNFKIPLEPTAIFWWENFILEKSHLVLPLERITIVDDPDDNKFIEAAIAGKSDYIVSQDKHLLKINTYHNIKILKPDEFIKLLKT